MGYLQGLKKAGIDPLEIAYADEFGYGLGRTMKQKRCWAPNGKSIYSRAPYRPQNCTVHLVLSPTRIVKVLASKIKAKNEECYEFICGTHHREKHAPHLGGRPVGTILKEEGVKYFIWDRLGRSGRAKNPTALHYDPRIKDALAKKGIQVSLSFIFTLLMSL